VYGHNDPGAHGAYLAAQAAGREKQMKFVGIDALPQEGVAILLGGMIQPALIYSMFKKGFCKRVFRKLE
jgi:ribose transport system substrate-binding protein